MTSVLSPRWNSIPSQHNVKGAARKIWTSRLAKHFAKLSYSFDRFRAAERQSDRYNIFPGKDLRARQRTVFRRLTDESNSQKPCTNVCGNLP